MILIDYNQLMLSNLLKQAAMNGGQFSIDFARHMILNSIRSYRSKFHHEYGEIVLCCDGMHGWRKDVFQHYKANRKKSRKSDDVDWNKIFHILNTIRTELQETFPYKFVMVDSAEADDIIAVICKEYGVFLNNGENEKILIISSDKDFAQLQKYANVEQYSPVQKKWICVNNPARALHEHILVGDVSDGIPNFLSDDDVFVTEKRQKQLGQKKIDDWNGLKPQDFCDENMLRGYKRNQELIDFDYIPEEVSKEIIERFNESKFGDRSKLFNYFVKNKLVELVAKIQEF